MGWRGQLLDMRPSEKPFGRCHLSQVLKEERHVAVEGRGEQPGWGCPSAGSRGVSGPGAQEVRSADAEQDLVVAAAQQA